MYFLRGALVTSLFGIFEPALSWFNAAAVRTDLIPFGQWSEAANQWFAFLMISAFFLLINAFLPIKYVGAKVRFVSAIAALAEIIVALVITQTLTSSTSAPPPIQVALLLLALPIIWIIATLVKSIRIIVSGQVPAKLGEDQHRTINSDLAEILTPASASNSSTGTPFNANQAGDPNTPPELLPVIVSHSPQLQAVVALNPACFPELLEWIETYGTPEAMAVVSQRRAAGY